LTFSAKLKDDSRQGFARVYYPTLEQEKTFPFKAPKIVLHPKITMTGNVVDANGQAVAGASVAAVAFDREVARYTTGDDGTFTFKVPGGTPLNHLFAVKAKVGFDYQLYLGNDPNRFNGEIEEYDYTKPVTLTLDGAQRIVVIVTTPEARPAEGVRVKPWLLTDPRKKVQNTKNRFNSVGSDLLSSVTDENGVAAFDWFPHWVAQEVAFSITPPTKPGENREYASHHAGVQFEPKKDATILNYRLVRLGHPIVGKVLDEEGKPVVGVCVRMDIAEAARTTRTMYDAISCSDEQGRISFVVQVGHKYRCMIEDPRWSAPDIDAIFPGDADSVPELEFVVRPASEVER
jgi:hypothetical protein